MDKDFRQRVLMPLLLPLGVIGGIAVYVLSISRVLLAVPEVVATMTALFIALYVLFLGGMVVSKRRISGRALGGGLLIGMVAVVAAGAVAMAAGMREIHHEPEPGEPGEPVAEGIPDDAFVWVAVDIEFAQSPSSLPAGEVTIAIDNQDNLPHDVAFDEVGGGSPIVHADGGQVDVGTVALEPGTYTYFCAVPGHRATMEGTIEVTE